MCILTIRESSDRDRATTARTSASVTPPDTAVQRDRTRAPCAIYFQHARTGVTYLPHRVRRGRRPLFASENANSFVYSYLKTREKGNSRITRARIKIKSIKESNLDCITMEYILVLYTTGYLLKSYKKIPSLSDIFMQS